LAREFRRADVDAFLSELSARQLDEWLALYEIEAEEAERRNKQQRGRR
jgi:hypothetical protein